MKVALTVLNTSTATRRTRSCKLMENHLRCPHERCIYLTLL